MNIVYFVTEDNYFLSHRLPVALYAQKLGHKVHVVTKITNRRQDIEKHGFNLIPLNFSRSTLNFANDIFVFIKMIKTLRAISPHIIHNVAIKPIIMGSLAALFCSNIRVVNAFTGMGFLFTSKLSFKYSILQFIVKCLLAYIVKLQSAYSIVQNEGDKDFIKLNFYSREDRIICIQGSGVDPNYFIPTKNINNSSTKNIKVITTCRMLKDKGVLDFYEAALILKNRGVPCTCVFAGALDSTNPSSIDKERLDQWISEGIIEYHGHTSDVLSVLRTANIYTLVSYREGLSKSILEAASVGMPIIATDIPASAGIVKNNYNGFLVPVRNAFALANAIEKLVLNHNLRKTFGSRSRSIVLKNFSEDVVCKKTLDFYNTIIT